MPFAPSFTRTHAASPGARYIRFPQFIMADKVNLLNFWPGNEANCAGSPNRWQPLRDAAFQLHGTHPAPAQELNHTQIVILDSLRNERGMNNTHELLHSLRTRCAATVCAHVVWCVGVTAVLSECGVQQDVPHRPCMPVKRFHALLGCRWKQHKSNEVFYQQHSAVEQLKMLASTSVLISNVGSRAFRMVFMPRGAQV